MKTLITIISLFLCLTLQAQVINKTCRQYQYWEPAPIENYITGAGFIATFHIVNQVEIKDRPATATICMITNVGLNLGIKAVRKQLKKRKARY